MNNVAVLLSTFSGGKYISEYLDSLCLQSYADFTVFVRDDGSTDATLKLIESFFSRLDIVIIDSDARFGAAKSFMHLLRVVPDSYSFFFFADQDDYWHQDKIKRAVDMLSLHVDTPALYCSRLELVDAELNHLSYSFLPHVFDLSNSLVECAATGCTIAMNSKARAVLNLGRPDFIFMHDWWAYTVISAWGVIVYDQYPTIKYRQHGTNEIGAEHSIIGLYKKRLKRFFGNSKDGVFCISQHAQEFLKCYSNLLNERQIQLASCLVEGKTSFLARLKLALFGKFYRQRFVDNFILRLIFLMNKY
jgi:glycosyltransferase involved in cell wall biosynthesis